MNNGEILYTVLITNKLFFSNFPHLFTPIGKILSDDLSISDEVLTVLVLIAP